MDRLCFLKISGCALGSFAIPFIPFDNHFFIDFESKRPPVDKRKFSSNIIEETIRKVKEEIRSAELAWVFENCFPNTLDTTVSFRIENGKPSTFIITGDIHAMWLRDSTAQVWPYLSFIEEDNKLKQLIKGLIFKQTELIQIDPYANAFNDGPTGSIWGKDQTVMKPELHERKWEIDSLCYPVRLAYNYYKITGDKSPFDLNWLKTARLILRTFREQQRKEGPGPYRFMRVTSKATDTLPGDGYGNPVKPIGLICSSFRPSDDATVFPFLIPSNFFAVKSLRQIAQLSSAIYSNIRFSNECNQLADEVETVLKKYSISEHPEYGPVLVYETDGYLNKLLMDDANVPSLLSLPYLGCIDINDPVYVNTRKYVLSNDNPWYFIGKSAKGVGGPHIGKNMIWPISIIIQALTSNNDAEIIHCIKSLLNTHAHTGFMHESFHKDNPNNYTRSWFAWANSLFGELILKLFNENKQLLKEI